MDKENEPKLGSPKETSRLVGEILQAKPDKARRAERQLLNALKSTPDYDPVFYIVQETQRLLIARNNPSMVRGAARLLTNVFSAASETKNDMEPRILHISPAVLKSADVIEAQDQKIQKDKFLRENMPVSYATLVEGVVPEMRRSIAAGINTMQLIKDLDDTKKDIFGRTKFDYLQNLTSWKNTLVNLTHSDDAFTPSITHDHLIDHLKVEPTSDQYDHPNSFFDEILDGTSLKEIESFSGPFSWEKYDKMTRYLTKALDVKGMNQVDATLRSTTLAQLFFIPHFFYKMDERIEYKNLNLIINLNHWQETVLVQLIFDDDEKRNQETKKLLEELPIYAASLLLSYTLPQWAVKPYLLNPKYVMGGRKNPPVDQYPFLQYALNEYRHNLDPEQSKFIGYTDDIAKEILVDNLIPLLRKKIAKLGLKEKYDPLIDHLEDSQKRESMEELRLAEFKEYFTEINGPAFLEQVSHYIPDIKKISEDTWESLFEKGEAHYLPMQEGANVIEFSKGSLPDLLGLEKIEIHNITTPQNWIMAINFVLHYQALGLVGEIGPDGHLQLFTPLESDMPELYTLLNHIAILVLHDLMVQEKKETGNGKKIGTKNEGQAIEGENESELIKSYGNVVPRIQRDRDIIESVYKKTGFKPRRVELHKMTLRGTKEYKAAVELYNEVTHSSQNESALQWIKEEVETARKNSFQASTKKVESTPARFKLDTIEDPITGDLRYLETWVIEHTSPKPSEEELKSPTKLFERYYKASSALAFLDQLKPWYVS